MLDTTGRPLADAAVHVAAGIERLEHLPLTVSRLALFAAILPFLLLALAGCSADDPAPVASSNLQAGPVFQQASQLFGSVPPEPGSRQTYQSRLGLSRPDRDSTNQGC